ARRGAFSQSSRPQQSRDFADVIDRVERTEGCERLFGLGGRHDAFSALAELVSVIVGAVARTEKLQPLFHILLAVIHRQDNACAILIVGVIGAMHCGVRAEADARSETLNLWREDALILVLTPCQLAIGKACDSRKAGIEA